jgi:hypothetical protein
MLVIPSDMRDDFNGDLSSLSRTVLKTWLNASFPSARVMDTMVDDKEWLVGFEGMDGWKLKGKVMS